MGKKRILNVLVLTAYNELNHLSGLVNRIHMNLLQRLPALEVASVCEFDMHMHEHVCRCV